MRLRITRPWNGGLDTSEWEALDPLLFRNLGDRTEAYIGAGARDVFKADAFTPEKGVLKGLTAFLINHNDWAFGHLAYDLKNELEQLSSRKPDHLGYPLANWFVPRFVVHLRPAEAVLYVHPEDRAEGEVWLNRLLRDRETKPRAEVPSFNTLTDRGSYLTKVKALLERIQRGDIYEINYCIERTALIQDWDVYGAFGSLLGCTKAPHAAFYRSGRRYALCASPERFLRIDAGVVQA